MFEFLEIFHIKEERINMNVFYELIIMNTKKNVSERQQES